MSTINLPTMFRNMEPVLVKDQSGILLNRGDAAPLKLSEAGKQSILLDEEVQAAIQEQETIRAAILEKHPSPSAAAGKINPLWEEYKKVDLSRKSLI
ncbi:hypothetical protein QBC33DRAFT_583844 [Phialemonium atrogriseum]|uniref:Uncharacterized protein n=1 Tax=Phialemonium atrogriseum TaxID=1093897 RepID=A0AAJ0FU27_9PEZI|nr:uncharacterized protein QBC33DRAFT_583844 [Phialemonium atrogriseum]KAK1772725.1 hypothetical protein QBC33DRAFT_583844 [Phialemonium atrogriseum]